MKKLSACILSISLFIFSNTVAAQVKTVDTMVNVGTYAIHFVLIEGKGTPIIFEAGGGDDASAWKDVLYPISRITGAPLLAYDRPGFGKSGMDTVVHGINPNLNGLETALKKLGFADELMFVAHSQGGIYAQVFAYRHPDRVKAAVMIDATTACFYQPERLAVTQHQNDEGNKKNRYTHPGIYFQGADLTANIDVARRSPFPTTIPVTDFVSDNPPFNDAIEISDWKHCHQQFVAEAANRVGIIALGCGHYIFKDNPPLVILAIAKAYAAIADVDKAKIINQRMLEYAPQAANESKQQELNYRHSEEDLNSWGYKLMQAGDLKNAVEVFKLNVTLHPASSNAYDSYGEALLKLGDKAGALKMYQKSVELNPGNAHGKEVIHDITSN